MFGKGDWVQFKGAPSNSPVCPMLVMGTMLANGLVHCGWMDKQFRMQGHYFDPALLEKASG